jgi:uncharacterized protein (DUF2141 family)
MNFALTFFFIIETILSNLYLGSQNQVKIQDSQKNNGIELIISNIKNKEGLIRIGVYSSVKGYPDNPQYSFSPAKDTIRSGKFMIFIPLKEPGNYAISILDDENSNGKMDYLFRIMPREGFGFSNNPKITGRRAPSFEQTSFLFEKGKMKISVRMVYI